MLHNDWPFPRPYDDPPAPKTYTAEELQAQLDAAVAGLKSTNTALKEEKTKVQDQLRSMNELIEGLGGAEGVKKLAEYRQKLASDELGRLLADGKHDEWFDRRTASLRGDYDKQMKAKDAAIVEKDQLLQKQVNRIHRMRLLHEVQSAARGSIQDVDEGTIDDILNAAEKVFVYDPETDRLVMPDKDTGVITGKDGKTPKSVGEWLEDQKTVKRRWWGPSRGSGLNGDDDTMYGGEKNPWSGKAWSITAQGQVIKQFGMDKARAMAKAAGVDVNATQPLVKSG